MDILMRYINLFLIIIIILLISCENKKSDIYIEISSDYRDIVFYKDTSYLELLHKINLFKKEINKFRLKYPEDENTTEFEKMLNDVKAKEYEISVEKNEYNKLFDLIVDENSFDSLEQYLQNITYFLNKYPNSIKKDYLKEKMDEFYFKQYLYENDNNINSIDTLNKVIDNATKYCNIIQNPVLKERIRSKINSLEQKRNIIHANEYSTKLNNLLNEMEMKARELAKEEHSFCSKITGFTKINQKEVNNTSRVEIACEYKIIMKGGFLCLFDYQVIVSVTGIVVGNPWQGTEYYLSGYKLISDEKM